MFTGEITKLTKIKLSAFCLKQVELSASGVSEIFVKQEADHFTYFKHNSLNLVLETRLNILFCLSSKYKLKLDILTRNKTEIQSKISFFCSVDHVGDLGWATFSPAAHLMGLKDGF